MFTTKMLVGLKPEVKPKNLKHCLSYLKGKGGLVGLSTPSFLYCTVVHC